MAFEIAVQALAMPALSPSSVLEPRMPASWPALPIRKPATIPAPQSAQAAPAENPLLSGFCPGRMLSYFRSMTNHRRCLRNQASQGEPGPNRQAHCLDPWCRVYARDIPELGNITSTKPGNPTGRWERMTWLDARMVTLLEMVDEREQGFEEEEFRQELLAFFGEVRVALVKARETTALLPQNPSSFFSSHPKPSAP